MATARSRSRDSAVRAIKAASRDPNHAAWRGASPLLSRQCSLCQAGDLRAAGQESIQYTIRLPANDVLQRRIGHLQTRLIGPPPKEPIISFASFRYQAKGWTRSRRAVARFEWQQGELYPRVRSEEHTSELQSLMRISYAVFCLKKKKNK